jgi:hypothetical protein
MVRHSLRSITHRLTHRDEINWNDLRTLVKELEVRVLRITACATKDNW